jgi:hypothetical protein
MKLTPPDGRRNPVRLDISEDEAGQWLAKGKEIKRRVRRPGSDDRSSQNCHRAGERTGGVVRKTTAANGRRKRPAKARLTTSAIIQGVAALCRTFRSGRQL